MGEVDVLAVVAFFNGSTPSHERCRAMVTRVAPRFRIQREVDQDLVSKWTERCAYGHCQPPARVCTPPLNAAFHSVLPS